MTSEKIRNSDVQHPSVFPKACLYTLSLRWCWRSHSTTRSHLSASKKRQATSAPPASAPQPPWRSPARERATAWHRLRAEKVSGSSHRRLQEGQCPVTACLSVRRCPGGAGSSASSCLFVFCTCPYFPVGVTRCCSDRQIGVANTGPRQEAGKALCFRNPDSL